MRLLLIACIALVSTVLASALLTLPAGASFPGRNGRLLFEVLPPQEPGASFGRGPVHLWAVAPRGGTAHNLGVVAPNEVQFLDARYTPDGRQIVYLHEIGVPTAPAARFSLDVMDANGSHKRVLARRPSLAQFAISPDGRSVAFLALDEQQNLSLYLTAIAHPKPRLLRRHWPNGSFEWAKDGRSLFVFGGDHCGICTMSPRTGATAFLPFDPNLFDHSGRTPALSPDQTRVAFYSPVGPAGARIYGLDGRFGRNIRGPYRCVGPFSPDGTELALADWCGGTTVHVSTFDLRTHRVSPLPLRVPVPPGGADRLLDWQPLGDPG